MLEFWAPMSASVKSGKAHAEQMLSAFTPESRHPRAISSGPLGAISELMQRSKTAASFDHLAGAGERRRRSGWCGWSVPFKNRPRSAKHSNGPNHQQPEWKHPQARNRLQSQSRQQQPLPAKHHEQQERRPKIN